MALMPLYEKQTGMLVPNTYSESYRIMQDRISDGGVTGQMMLNNH